MILAQNRHEDQWNGIEDPNTNADYYRHLIFDKGVQNMHCRKDSLFNKWCWENWISTCRRLKLDPSCLSSCTSIFSKWIKDFNVRSEMVKLLQEKIGNTLDLIGTDNNFRNKTLIAQQLRERIDK
jgi:hypothetical protein